MMAFRGRQGKPCLTGYILMYYVNRHLPSPTDQEKGPAMINLADVSARERIRFIDATDKDAALHELVTLLATSDDITDITKLEAAMFDREQVISTGIGLGVAVPHVRLASVTGMCTAVGVSRQGIDFNAFDGLPVHIIIMIAAPEDAHREYLGLLARIALLLKSESIRNSIVEAKSPEDIFAIIKGY